MINALYLEDVIRSFSDKGWQWIDAHRAFDHPVFKREPKTLPAGESLVWALAKETGRFEDRLRYPGEDGAYEKPKWMPSAFNRKRKAAATIFRSVPLADATFLLRYAALGSFVISSFGI
jgi:hypothetical protein